MESICFRSSQRCKTVGELKKLLEDIPDDMPIKPFTDMRRKLLIRFERSKEDETKKWITISEWK